MKTIFVPSLPLVDSFFLTYFHDLDIMYCLDGRQPYGPWTFNFHFHSPSGQVFHA